MFNYLVIGSGLYGSTFANLAHAAGKFVLVIDKRPHIGGNVYTERVEGINVHKYGAARTSSTRTTKPYGNI